MFSSKNTKNNVYPCKPQFYYIKVGFKGVKIIKASIPDDSYLICSWKTKFDFSCKIATRGDILNEISKPVFWEK